MSLGPDEIKKIAHLARLELNQDMIEPYAKELSSILDFIAQMDKADTQGIKPMAHPLETAQRLRPDTVTETDQRELFQSIAPKVEAGLYLVPQVIE